MPSNRPVAQCANAIVRGNNLSCVIVHIDRRIDASLVERVERDEPGVAERVDRLRNGHRRAVDIDRTLSHLCHPERDPRVANTRPRCAATTDCESPND